MTALLICCVRAGNVIDIVDPVSSLIFNGGLREVQVKTSVVTFFHQDYIALFKRDKNSNN